jgi:hypothetical protein
MQLVLVPAVVAAKLQPNLALKYASLSIKVNADFRYEYERLFRLATTLQWVWGV